MKLKHYIFITAVLVLVFYGFIFLFRVIIDKISYVYDYHLIAERYLKKGKLDKALNVYKKRIASCEREIKFYKTYQERREPFETQLRNDCKTLGKLLVTNKRYNEALTYYLKMLHDLEAFKFIGEMKFQQGNLKESAEAFKIAVFQDFRNYDEIVRLYQGKIKKTDDPIYKIYLAIFYYNTYKVNYTKKYLNLSFNLLKELVKERPKDSLILRYLGLIYMIKGDEIKGIDYLSQAINSNLDDYVSYFCLERCDKEKVGFDPFEKFKIDKKPIIESFIDEKSLKNFKTFRSNVTRKYQFNVGDAYKRPLKGVIIAKSTKALGIGAIVSVQVGREKIFRYIDSDSFEPYEFEFSDIKGGKNEFSISLLNDSWIKSSIINEDRNLYIDNLYLIKGDM